MEKKKIVKTKKVQPAKVRKTAAKPAAQPKGEMLAVLPIGGSQYLVSEGSTLKVDLLEGEVDSQEKITGLILDPKITKGTITYKILEHTKGPKIRVAIYKAKSRYRKVRGFRAQLSEIQIEKIEEGK